MYNIIAKCKYTIQAVVLRDKECFSSLLDRITLLVRPKKICIAINNMDA